LGSRLNEKGAVASAQTLNAHGIGSVIVSTKDATKRIFNAVYIPDLKINLLSINKMIKNDHIVVFNSTDCHVYDSEDSSVSGKIIVTTLQRFISLDTSQIANLVMQTDDKKLSDIKGWGTLIVKI